MRLLIRVLCGVTSSYISCNEFLMLCNTNDGLFSQLKRYRQFYFFTFILNYKL